MFYLVAAHSLRGGTAAWTTSTWNGCRTAVWISEEPPVLSFEVVGSKPILTYSGGSLEASSDLILWNPVEVTEEGKYEVDTPPRARCSSV